MDRKQAIRDYKRTIQPMGIVRIRNLENGRSFIMRSANTPGTLNRLRFQLENGAFTMSPELCRDWKELGAEHFAFEVLDELKAVEDPEHDYEADLEALEELWMDKLEPYGDKGYHSPRKTR